MTATVPIPSEITFLLPRLSTLTRLLWLVNNLRWVDLSLVWPLTVTVRPPFETERRCSSSTWPTPNMYFQQLSLLLLSFADLTHTYVQCLLCSSRKEPSLLFGGKYDRHMSLTTTLSSVFPMMAVLTLVRVSRRLFVRKRGEGASSLIAGTAAAAPQVRGPRLAPQINSRREFSSGWRLICSVYIRTHGWRLLYADIFDGTE